MKQQNRQGKHTRAAKNCKKQQKISESQQRVPCVEHRTEPFALASLGRDRRPLLPLDCQLCAALFVVSQQIQRIALQVLCPGTKDGDHVFLLLPDGIFELQLVMRYLFLAVDVREDSNLRSSAPLFYLAANEIADISLPPLLRNCNFFSKNRWRDLFPEGNLRVRFGLPCRFAC